MATKYIINNEDGLITTGQTINGGISATTISANTVYMNGNPIVSPSYKTYSAMLTQSGTSAPYAVQVFQDDFGDITFSYNGVGWYSISSPQFVYGKTIINGTNPYLTSLAALDGFSTTGTPSIKFGGGPSYFEIYVPFIFNKSTFTTSLSISTREGFPTGVASDDILNRYNLYVEIKLFP